MLELENVVKRYGPREVVKGVSFTLRPGDFLGLIGPNGAGKSTTLRMIVGMLQPSAGAVRVNGVDVGADPLAARRSIGYVPEYIALYDYLTCAEYLDFVGEVKGMGADARAAEARELIELLDLGESADLLVRTYSQGMRRKVALAGAMMGAPPILVLDEAMNGLDPTTIARLKVHLRALAEGGTALLLSSHVLDVVERICNRIVVLAAGQVVEDVDAARLADIRAREGGLEGHFLRLMGAAAAELT